jgi:hypothetical protein
MHSSFGFFFPWVMGLLNGTPFFKILSEALEEAQFTEEKWY